MRVVLRVCRLCRDFVFILVGGCLFLLVGFVEVYFGFMGVRSMWLCWVDV